ncbi:MAG: AEC family transporter [Clostridia bacterium]|nr:AEC family transporter [Clostridia bacterium]MCI2001067.1 AEC family transporter [Clostridia bacterium]MCI2015807.1 AEC family transporter [Clostridia bacterium]
MTVFTTTLNQMAILFIFILIGFFLKKRRLLPEDGATVLSKLETNIIMPALILNTFISKCTFDVISQKTPIILWGIAIAFVSVIVAIPLSVPFAEKGALRKIYCYSIAIANSGFMGNAVMIGVFGNDVFFDYLIFTMPINIVIYTWGVSLLMPSKGGNPLLRLINPICMSMVIGAVIGLTKIAIPACAMTVLKDAAACMAPLAMILTGFTIGRYDIKKLLTDKKVYIVTALRLLILPAFFVFLFRFLGMSHDILILALCTVAMPLGLNTVVFPAAYGGDTSTGASMALISHTLSVLTIPFVFAVLL